MLGGAAALVIIASLVYILARDASHTAMVIERSRTPHCGTFAYNSRGTAWQAAAQSAALSTLGAIAATLRSGKGAVLRAMHPADGDRAWTVRDAAAAAGQTALRLAGFARRAAESSRAMGRHAMDMYAAVPHGDVALAAAGTAAMLLALRALTLRYRSATEIPQALYRRGAVLHGVIVAASDSDNVRFCHRSALQRMVPLVFARGAPPRSDTVNVRLAGIDAPEMGHFGAPRQPFASEAKAFLARLVEGRTATVRLHRVDQYARAVATVHVRTGLFSRTNVSLAMAQAGFATVYTSAGAEYGGIRASLEAAEQRARYDSGL